MVYAGVGGRTDYTSGTYAIDARTGKQIWHVQNQTGPVPYVAAPGVVFGVGGDDSNVIYASSATTGRAMWTFRATHMNAGAGNLWLGYADQTIFTSTHVGGKPAVLALDGHTGRRRWVASFSEVVQGLTVAEQVVYAGMAMPADVNAGRVVALNALSGKSLWDTSGVATAPEDLVVVGDAVCGGTWKPSSNQAFALNRATGNPLWQAKLGRVLDMEAASGLVFACTDSGGSADSSVLWAMDARTGTRVWKRTFHPSVSALTAADHALYIGCDDGSLHAAAAASGAQLWSYRLPDTVCDIAVYLGAVYAGDFSGGVYALQA